MITDYVNPADFGLYNVVVDIDDVSDSKNHLNLLFSAHLSH
jgi:hypothetical protein